MELLSQGPGALAEYYEWFDDASPGETLVYWVGDLQFDRDIMNFDNPHRELKRRVEALDALALRILSDAEQGFVILTQKRLHTSQFQYRVTMKRKADGHSDRNSKKRSRPDLVQ